MNTTRDSEPPAREFGTEGATADRTGAGVHAAQNHEVETFTGRYVDVLNPDPATIALEDIAHSLANTCRFGGHSREFYSVAEHAVRVANKLVAQGFGALALAGLHHDDAEAYLRDIPRPVKPLLGGAYRRLTTTMDIVIAHGLGDLWAVPDLDSVAIHDADTWALRLEALSLMPSGGEGWNWPFIPWRVFGPVKAFMSPAEAEHEFLVRHAGLVKAWASAPPSLTPEASINEVDQVTP